MIDQPQSLRHVLTTFLRAHWLIILGLFLALLVSSLMEVYPVRLMQAAIDTVLLRDRHWALVLELVILWYACRTVGCLVGLASGVLAGIMSAKLGYVVRKVVFERLRATGLQQIEKVSASETVTRALSDASDLGTIMTEPIVLVGQGVFIFLWSFILLLHLDPVLLASCAPLGVLMLFAGRYVSGLNRKVWMTYKAFYTRVIDCLLETIAAYRDIAVFDLWSRQQSVFAQSNEGVLRMQRSTATLTSSLDSFIKLLWPLATVVCLILGGYRVMVGRLSPGGMVAFMWYVQWVIHPISQLATYQAEIQKSLVAAKRVQEMLDWFPPEPVIRDRTTITREIKLEGVSFQYGCGEEVLHNVDLVVRKGEVIALVGPTGCGKTTLVKLLLGLLRPCSGRILVDGRAVDASELCGSISMAAVFQEAYLFDLSIRDNVLLGFKGPPETRETVLQRSLVDATVTGFLAEMTEAENTTVGERATRLSSGQRQRVALARALAKQPMLLILDEATAAIDTATEKAIYQSLSERRDELACIIVSHRLASVIGADRIYVVNRGRICASGSHSDLLLNCPEYRELYSAQLAPGGIFDERPAYPALRT